MAKFTLSEIEERTAEAENRRIAEAAAAEEEQKAMIFKWMTVGQKADIIIVSSSMGATDEFNTNLISLIINHGSDLDIGFFVGSCIMKDELNKLIIIGDMIKRLKEVGIQSSIVLDHLLEAIMKFC